MLGQYSGEANEDVIMEGSLHAANLGGRMIHEVFEEQARRYPDAIAVSYRGQRLTYSDLNRRSQQLAWHLIRRGARPECLIAIWVERGLEMVIGLLAILKAGAAYMPLDRSFPAERMRYMLEDCNPLLLLTQQHLLTEVPSTAIEPVVIDSICDMAAALNADELTKLHVSLTARNIAYVIYTSGSTGMPKGVMVEHANVTGFLAALYDLLNLRPGLTWTQFHSVAFDFSVLEMWGALLSGAHLAIVPFVTSRFPRDVHLLLSNEGVQVFGQTPSAFRRLVGVDPGRPHSLSLQVIILGGEALQVSSLKPWYDSGSSDNVRVINLYGPTEITVAATGHPVRSTDTDPHGGSVIGAPLSNSTILLLTKDHETADAQGTGEIYIGGTGVARGYFNRPDLTAQRFIANPREPNGARLYRSGDLGLWRTDGELEYRGRNDSQVKIRGFRVELGDIESHLAAIEGVREGVVVLKEHSSDEAQLVAYLTLKDRVSLTPSALRASLTRRLPIHMVPLEFVILPQLPLNTSGKIDRKALLFTRAPSASHPADTCQ